ncbi:MAG: WYL domain-containing protein [Spirochaetales bacterium]|jgi:predicted DNA-binding transcriptional regulator YafY|nr:WYL domain-containing protein [Spirochaetales bacterium]
MKARKNLPKTALPRIYFIDRKIASGAYPSTASLAREYETSMSSISRDIDFMKTMLNAPIEYSPLRRGYYYAEKTWRLPAGYTTERDMLALGMAKALLSLYQNTPLHAAAQELLESLTAPLKGGKEPFWYENRIVVPRASFASVMPETWDIITSALRENRVITFDYRGGWDTAYMPRRVRPYQLLFDASLWYLYAWAEERKAVRVFSVSRIKNAALTTDTFILPADYDYRVEADGSYFGVFSGAKKHTFRVAFYDESGVWAGERKWAADQSVRETKNGIIITFSSVQYDKVLEWVLSRGGRARPLAPKVLVADWKRHIQAMTKRAKERK